MLEIMKRNKILTYAFLMAIPMTTGNIFLPVQTTSRN